MKKPSEILLEAKELISDPLKWTKVFLARNKYDRDLDPCSPFACKWCAAGAVIHIAAKHHVDEESVLWHLRKATLKWKLHGRAGSPAILNDLFKHEDVMMMFDEAIVLAQEKENEQK